jgi:MoaD family protein
MNINIKVHYLGLVKTYTNQSQDEIELNQGATLFDLLNKLAADFGKQFTENIYEPGAEDVKPTFSVTINGVFIGQLEGLNTKLKDRDTVILMPLVTGG